MTAAPNYPSWLLNGEWERPKPQKRTPRNPEFLTAMEAAAMLRVSKNTMYRLVQSGDIPHVR
ncbi:MAG: helix-turn-helix domain-containing protein, partial [Blastococcus sp.]